jgi:hypothetical protein
VTRYVTLMAGTGQSPRREDGLPAGRDGQSELLMADGLHGHLQDPPQPGLEDAPGDPGRQGAPVGQHEQHPA